MPQRDHRRKRIVLAITDACRGSTAREGQMRRFWLVISACVAAAGLTASLSQARAQTPIGVILAVGDIMQCNEFRKRSMATARLVADEISALGEIPVHVLLLGDLASKGAKKDFECFARNWDDTVRTALRN